MASSIQPLVYFQNLLEARKERYSFVEAALASNRADGTPRLVRGALRFWNKEPDSRDIVLDYGDLVLERIRLPAEQGYRLILDSLVSEVKSTNLVAVLPKSTMELSPWAWSEFRGLPNPIGSPRFSRWPSRSFLLTREDRVTMPLPPGPIANTRLPIISDPFSAVDEFLEFPMSRYQSATGLAVFLPDFRARFSKVVVGDQSILVDFEPGELSAEELMMRAVVDNRDPGQSFAIDWQARRATLSGMDIDRSLEVFLLDRSKDQVIDWVQLRQNQTDFFSQVEFASPGAQVQRLVRLGENDVQEFKRDLGDGDRLIESVVAFANSKGGTVFLGIDDEHGYPHPVDQKGASESVERMIRANCDPYVQVNFENSSLDNVPILLIRVPEGGTKPYVFRKRGTVHVRGGRTNFLATSEEIRRLASPKQSNPFS